MGGSLRVTMTYKIVQAGEDIISPSCFFIYKKKLMRNTYISIYKNTYKKCNKVLFQILTNKLIYDIISL